MKINWKVRFKQKPFIIAFVSAVLLAADAIAGLFGVAIPADFAPDLMNALETVLYVLVFVGVIVDPTTDGVEDSTQAQKYVAPRKKWTK